MEDKQTRHVIHSLVSQYERVKEPRNMAEEIKIWLETIREKIQAPSSSVGGTAGPLSGNPVDYPEIEKLIDVYLSFSDHKVKAKLEELMGSNVIHITDRNYMLQLQAKLLEEYEYNLRKRMKEREKDEVEREKRLILSGKMPIEDAPAELEDHPVFKITQFTRKILQEKRERAMKRTTFKCRPTISMEALAERKKNGQTGSTLVTDRSKPHSNDSDLKLGSTEALDLISVNSETRKSVVLEEVSGFMFTQEEYDNLKYEAPLVKKLRTIQDIEEMYKLADSIVGPFTLYKRPKQQQHQYIAT